MISESITTFGKPLECLQGETPKPAGTQVLVRVTRCGVCHSDVHLQEGYFDLGGGNKLDLGRARTLPMTLGHEIEGTIVTAGPEAAGAKPGTRVVVYPWIGCGSCAVCARGDEHLCFKPQSLGVDKPGGFADHCLVPHPRYLLDPTGIPEGLAATYMCSGLTAYGALKKLGALGPKDPLLIVGLGGVGMMGFQFARALFGGSPHVADVDPGKLEKARSLGAGGTYDVRDKGAVKQILAATGGVAGAVDFVGSESSLALASAALGRNGMVIVVGLFGGALNMPIPMFPLRVIGIRGTFVGSLAEAKDVLTLVKAGKIAPIPVETRPLSAANQALDDLRNGRIVGRVVLSP